MVHEAIATDSLSVHITLGFKAPRIVDIVKTFSKETINNAFFRKSLFLSDGVDRLKLEEEVKEKLHTLINQISLDELFEKIKVNFSDLYFESHNDNTLQHLIDVKRVNIKTKITSKKDLEYSTNVEPPFFYLKFGGKEEEFPFFLKPTIEHLLNETKGIYVNDLVGNFSDGEKINLAKRLLIMKVIEIVG